MHTQLAKLVDDIILKNQNSNRCVDIFDSWDQIVDKNISKKSHPYKISSDHKNNKTLILNVKKGYTLEIQHQIPLIINQINKFFKESLFNRIRIIQKDYE